MVRTLNRAPNPLRRRIPAFVAATGSVALVGASLLTANAAAGAQDGPTNAGSLSLPLAPLAGQTWFVQPFDDSTAPSLSNWVIGGSASVATTAGQTPATVLELTDDTEQVGFAEYDDSIPPSTGLEISFNIATWGNSNATGIRDGMTFYLRDAREPVPANADDTSWMGYRGAALGYAPYVGLGSGMSGALLGMAFSNGGFASTNADGPGPSTCTISWATRYDDRNLLALRGGPGFGGGRTGNYCLLAQETSTTVPFTTFASASYTTRASAMRSVRMVIMPRNVVGATITVFYGATEATQEQVMQVPLPQNLINFNDDSTIRVGFTAATGAGWNRQDIWGVEATTIDPATVVAPNGSMTAGGTPALAPATGRMTNTPYTPITFTTDPVCTAMDGNNPVSSSTPVGTYPVTCAGGGAVGYYIDDSVAGQFTVTPPYIPPTPVYPPSAPRDVTATAGDGSATVSWSPPADSGSFPVTNYRVIAGPGGASCLVTAPTTSCVVPGLINGTTYTFSVEALNGAGWGPPSAPSNPVTPAAPTIVKLVLDQGTRVNDGRHDRIRTTGSSIGIPSGVRLTPFVRYTGQSSFQEGKATIVVQSDGTFTWTRQIKKSKGVTGYVTYQDLESNRVFWAALR